MCQALRPLDERGVDACVTFVVIPCPLDASCLDAEPQGAGPVWLPLRCLSCSAPGSGHLPGTPGAPLLHLRPQGRPQAQGGGAQTLSHILPGGAGTKQDSYLEVGKRNAAAPSSRAVLPSATRWGCRSTHPWVCVPDNRVHGPTCITPSK